MNYVALGCIAGIDDCFVRAYEKYISIYIDGAEYPITNHRKPKFVLSEEAYNSLEMPLRE